MATGRGFEQQDLVRRKRHSLVARALVDCGIDLVKSRQTIIWKQIPARFRGDELVVLRSDTRIGIQGSESHRHLGPMRPSPAEETRPADRAEGLHRTIVIGTVDPDEILAFDETKVLSRYPSLGQAERPRMSPAPRAVAMVGEPEGQRHFKADAAAEAAAGERLGGDRRSVHDATIASVLRNGELSDESPGRRSLR